MLIIKLLLLFILGAIFYQDLKERQVYWFLFPLSGCCCAILFYNSTLPELFYASISLNFLFISLLFSIVFLYAKLKLHTSFMEALGLGDILFFLALIFSFSTISFLVVFVFALFFSFMLHLYAKRYSKIQSVPLAGYVSFFYGLVYISHWTGITTSLYTL